MAQFRSVLPRVPSALARWLGIIVGTSLGMTSLLMKHAGLKENSNGYPLFCMISEESVRQTGYEGLTLNLRKLLSM